MTVNSAFYPNTFASNGTGGTGTSAAPNYSLSDYNKMSDAYYAKNPYNTGAGDTSGQSFAGNPQDWSPAAQSAMGNQMIQANQGYNNWLNTMSPEMQAQYKSLDAARFAAANRRSQEIFATAALGGGLAGFGATGGFGAGIGSGTTGTSALALDAAPSLSYAPALSEAGGAMMTPLSAAGAGTADAAALGFGTDAIGTGGATAGNLATVGGGAGMEAAGAGAGSLTAGMTPGSVAASELGLPDASNAASTSPWSNFIKPVVSTLLSKTGTGGNSLLGGLISAGLTASQGNKGASQYNDVINQINGLYAPDSPYAMQMKQAMERKDAAAGRNSQYGDRAVQLAAALTNSKAQALTSAGYTSDLASRITQQNQGTNALSAIFGSGAGQNLITQAGTGIANQLQQYFGNNGNMSGSISDYTNPNSTSDYSSPDWNNWDINNFVGP